MTRRDGSVPTWRRKCFVLFLLATLPFVSQCGGKTSETPSAADGHVKNIILMISDGAGYNMFDMASYYQHGTLGRQVYDGFPVKYACTTYNTDRDGRMGRYDPKARWAEFKWAKSGFTGSAPAATALYTGVKTHDGAIAVDLDGQPLETIAEIAKQHGRSSGVVTTVPFSNATPAVWAAHNVDRENYAEIAREMIDGTHLDVIMGGGSPDYDEMGNLRDPGQRKSAKYVGGDDTWTALKAGTAGGDTPWKLIQSKAEFEALADGTLVAKRVIGVPHCYKSLQTDRPGDKKTDPYAVPFNPRVPTLVTMTRGALNVLSRNPDGFVLMVEGGAVDWANHARSGGRAIEEQIDFNHAVEVVVKWVEAHSSWEETLLIVTSDHECGCIWGPNAGPDSDTPFEAIVNNGKGRMPGHRYFSANHTNALVPLYAKGAGADMFRDLIDGEDPVRGPYIDNTDVFTVMRSALLGAVVSAATR